MKTELTINQVQAILASHNLANHAKALPYRGYATLIADDGKRQKVISQDVSGHYFLEDRPSGAVEIAKGVLEYPNGSFRCDI